MEWACAPKLNIALTFYFQRCATVETNHDWVPAILRKGKSVNNEESNPLCFVGLWGRFRVRLPRRFRANPELHSNHLRDGQLGQPQWCVAVSNRPCRQCRAVHSGRRYGSERHARHVFFLLSHSGPAAVQRGRPEQAWICALCHRRDPAVRQSGSLHRHVPHLPARLRLHRRRRPNPGARHVQRGCHLHRRLPCQPARHVQRRSRHAATLRLPHSGRLLSGNPGSVHRHFQQQPDRPANTQRHIADHVAPQ